METHGRLAAAAVPRPQTLSAFDEDLLVRVAEMVKLVQSDDPKNRLAPKTVNDSRTWLSVALGEAVRRNCCR